MSEFINLGYSGVEQKQAVLVTDFFIEVAKGNIPGHSIIHKFGHNLQVNSTRSTLWSLGTADYVYLTENTTLKISSSSTDDDVGGTGALTVQLYGQDTNYAELEETITLTGQVAVNTVNQYFRIYRMVVKTAGSGGENAGIIYAGTGTVTDGVPANKYAAVDAGYNQSQMALYTIPAGKTGYGTHPYVSLGHGTTGSGDDIDAELAVRPVGEVFQVKHEIHAATGSGAYVHPNWFPHIIPEKSDVEIRAEITGNGEVEVAGGFEILLVDNNLLDKHI